MTWDNIMQKAYDMYTGGSCPVEKPNITICIVCKHHFRIEATCEAEVEGYGTGRVCFSCLHDVDKRSEEALHAFEEESSGATETEETAPPSE